MKAIYQCFQNISHGNHFMYGMYVHMYERMGRTRRMDKDDAICPHEGSIIKIRDHDSNIVRAKNTHLEPQ